MNKTLHAIKITMNATGDHKVFVYAFSKQYHNGCNSHPDLQEHAQMAEELTAISRKTLNG